jgi:hypothetical protein
MGRGAKRKKQQLNNSNDSEEMAEEIDTQSISKKLSDFLLQLENLDKTTAEILKLSNDPRINVCFENLCALSKASSLLLQSFPPKIELLEKEIATIPQKIDSAIQEEVRKRSVVLMNVPESKNPSSSGRARSDMEKVNQILDLCEIEAVPSAVFRVGVVSEGRPRLLKVILQRRQAARDLLTKRSKLLESAFKNVFIRESLTKEQLAERKNLIMERVRRNGALLESERNNPWVLYAGILQRRSEIPTQRARQNQ